MGQVKFDYSKTAGYVHEHEVESMKALTESARKLLLSKSGAGNDYLGWIDLPVDYDKEEFARIKKAAEKIKSDSDVLVVIGIGGSYLGARAAIEFLGHNFFNSVSKDLRKAPEIYFVGNSISSNYLAGLVDVIGDRDFSVNIISKSGTTTEPAIAFRVFKKMLEEKYGKEDFKIASYYKKDYVSYQTIFTVIWVTIGYVVLFGVFAAAFVETFLSNVGLFAIVLFVLAAVALYLILVVSYGLFASGFYQKKHIRAKGRVKRYIRMLTQLDKFYSKERKKKNE